MHVPTSATRGLDDAPNTRALLGLVAFGSALTAMTSSVINVALPDMARDFHTDPSYAAWFNLSFLLTVTVLLLAAGRIGDLVGHGRMYLIGFLVFGVGSMACALAPAAEWLIAGRAVQGFGSAAIMASSPALLTQSMPPQRRGFALGFMSTALYVGLTIGPPVGGHMVEHLGWRSIFWASLAAALVVCGVGAKVLPRQRTIGKQGSFDVVGAVLVGLGLLGVLLLSTRAPAWGIGHPRTLGLAAGSVILLGAFAWYELRHTSPTLDLRLFRSVQFSGAAASAILNYIALFIAIYLLPFALRDGQHMSPPLIGQILASQAAAMALLAWGSGWLSDRIGSRGLAAGGMAVAALGLGGLGMRWPTVGWAVPALWLFVTGAGTGVFISPNSSALMGAAPGNKQGVAGGVMALARTLGMALGMAVGSGLFAVVFASQRGAAVRWIPEADVAVQTGLLIAAGFAALSGLVAYVTQPAGPSRHGVV